MSRSASNISARVIAAAVVGLAVIWWLRLWSTVVLAGVVVWQVRAIRNARKRDQELATFTRTVFGILDGGLIGVGFGLLQSWLHYPASDTNQSFVNDWWLGRTIGCSVFSANCGILIGMLLAFTPRGIRNDAVKYAVGGAGIGMIISYLTRSTIPGADVLLGCVYSFLCAIVAVGLVMWRGGVRTIQPMLQCGRWIFSTLQLASLLLGCALLLLSLAALLAEVLNQQYRFDDDWSVLGLPVGIVVGLILVVKYRDRRWLHRLSTVMLVGLIGFTVYLAIPQQAPESTPPGMNQLPFALGNILRGVLLYVLIITGSVSCVVATITNVVLQTRRPDASGSPPETT